MRLPPFLPLLLILWPLLEIATFIWVGGQIGVINTIALILVAAFAGLALFRWQGLGLFRRIRAELEAGCMPAGPMLEGFVVLLAGFLLALPGFLSDILAFFLLFAPFRRLLIAAIFSRMSVTTTATSATWTSRGYRNDGVVDLDPDDYRRGDGSGSPAPEDTVRLPPGEGTPPDRP